MHESGRVEVDLGQELASAAVIALLREHRLLTLVGTGRQDQARYRGRPSPCPRPLGWRCLSRARFPFQSSYGPGRRCGNTRYRHRQKQRLGYDRPYAREEASATRTAPKPVETEDGVCLREERNLVSGQTFDELMQIGQWLPDGAQRLLIDYITPCEQQHASKDQVRRSHQFDQVIAARTAGHREPSFDRPLSSISPIHDGFRRHARRF